MVPSTIRPFTRAIVRFLTSGSSTALPTVACMPRAQQTSNKYRNGYVKRKEEEGEALNRRTGWQANDRARPVSRPPEKIRNFTAFPTVSVPGHQKSVPPPKMRSVPQSTVAKCYGFLPIRGRSPFHVHWLGADLCRSLTEVQALVSVAVFNETRQDKPSQHTKRTARPR